MKTTILFFCFFGLIAYNSAGQKTITIIGLADNAKAGAVVVSGKDSAVYYLEGIHSWKQKVVGKKVKVTGQLIIEKMQPQKKGELPRQQVMGDKRIILNPKWKLIKK